MKKLTLLIAALLLSSPTTPRLVGCASGEKECVVEGIAVCVPSGSACP